MAPCRTGRAAAAFTWSAVWSTGETPKTKAALESLRKITQARSVLVVVDEGDELTWLSLRNGPRCTCWTPAS